MECIYNSASDLAHASKKYRPRMTRLQITEAGAAYIDREMEDMARKIRLSAICPLLLFAVFVYVLRALFSMNLWSRLTIFTASDSLPLIFSSDSLSLLLCLYFSARTSVTGTQYMMVRCWPLWITSSFSPFILFNSAT